MALYEITLGTWFNGNVCVNRWNYLMSGTPASVLGSLALATAFGGVLDEGNPVVDTILYRVGQLVTAPVEFTDIMVKNIYDPVDFFQTPLGFNGTQAGDTLPPFAAFGFKTNRTRLDIRRGTKRFVGVPEFAQVGGNITESGAITRLANLATAMSAVLTYNNEGNTLSFAPVVVGRDKVRLNPGETPERYSYKYYPTYAEQLPHLMQSITWSNYPTVRSQTSRQYGRGQ